MKHLLLILLAFTVLTSCTHRWQTWSGDIINKPFKAHPQKP